MARTSDSRHVRRLSRLNRASLRGIALARMRRVVTGITRHRLEKVLPASPPAADGTGTEGEFTLRPPVPGVPCLFIRHETV